MPISETKLLRQFLKLAANEKKYKIIRHLARGEECVCDIAGKLKIEQSLVSHHLNSLRKARLINDRKIGTWVHCSLKKSSFAEIGRLFAKYFGPDAISQKMCSVHKECQCLFERKD